jgi:hypothetical protein
MWETCTLIVIEGNLICMEGTCLPLETCTTIHVILVCERRVLTCIKKQFQTCTFPTREGSCLTCGEGTYPVGRDTF